MSLYRKSQWKIFRQGVIELDDYKCRQCGRGQDEVTLQVHHKEYKSGLKAWEYPTADCLTLCKGCHAQIHGIIQPSFGWEYIGDEDLGDLIGTCENRSCGSNMRYSYTVFHPQWGTLEVGTVCCDHLTDSKIASNLKESQLKFEGRRQRFLNSKRWTTDRHVHKLKQGLFDIEVFEVENQFSLRINGDRSKIRHESSAAAKERVFEVIESGELIKYFKDKNFDFGKQEKRRKTKNS
jgi:hypothetical protein